MRRQLFIASEDANPKQIIQIQQTQIYDVFPPAQPLSTSNRHRKKPNVPMLNLVSGRILKSPNLEFSNKKISFPLNSAQKEPLATLQTESMSPNHPNQMPALNSKGEGRIENDFMNRNESPQKYEGSLVYFLKLLFKGL